MISGYLITSIILKDMRAGTFSLAHFYERRARRILPALFTVMLVCLPFAWFWVLPPQLEDFAQSLVSVIFFASNFLFCYQLDYFSRGAEEMPLLHTWSLGVEEQYYVLFPIFVIIAWRFGFRRMTLMLLGIALISLMSAEVFKSFGEGGRYSFFLTPARAWELLAGSIIAFAAVDKPLHQQVKKRTANGLAALGLVMVCVAIFTFDKKTSFPGFAALLPVIGTALIIAFAHGQTWVGKLLSWRIFVGVGLISYSAYLWHQPLFAFARTYSIGGPSSGVYGLLAAASLVFAYLTWRFVETPTRNPKNFTRKQVFKAAAIGSLFFVAVGIVGILGKGFEGRFTPQQREWFTYLDSKKMGAYVRTRFNDLRDQDFTDSPKKKILIIGDSYGQDFTNGIFENNYLTDYEIRTVHVSGRCQIYIGDDHFEFIRKPDHALCLRKGSLENYRDLITKADVVILAASWRYWAAEKLPQTIARLGLKPEQRLFVIGRKNFGPVRVKKYIYQGISDRTSIRQKFGAEHKKTNDVMAASLPADIFVNQHRILCGDADTCPIFTPEGRLMTHDGGHLTQAGATYIGKQLFENSVLKELIAKP